MKKKKQAPRGVPTKEHRKSDTLFPTCKGKKEEKKKNVV